MRAHICMGSQASDVTHFEWPFRASPNGLPVFGSHNRTFAEVNTILAKYISQRTCPSCPPVANFLSIASHSVHSTQPLCPDSTCDGVSVNKSHKRALQSPEPVARRLPVGENDAHRMGEVCPESVEEHLVAGRTLNTAWGAQRITKTSSGVKAFDGWLKTSSSIDFEITISVGCPTATASCGNDM